MANSFLDKIKKAKIEKSKELFLSNMRINDLNPLKELTDLHVISFYNTEVNDLSPLQELKNLQQLSFSNTQISDLSPLKELKNLRIIAFDLTKIVDLSPLKELTNLNRLYFDDTQISDLSPLKELTNLNRLSFDKTKISDLSPLKELKNLQILSFDDTEITDLSPLQDLSNLQKLSFSNTKITDLSPLKKLITNGIILSMDNCPFINPPKSIVEKGAKAILNYFKQLEEQGGTEPIFEARLLIVGEPGAGKTSLMKKLIDPAYEVKEGKSESTVGINIHEGWGFPFSIDKKIVFRANLWDFGGQEIQYQTHQFFLSGRVLYVIMADNRKQNTNFPYWFEIIHLLGKDENNRQSPILVILNENEHKSVTNYDHDGFCESYKETEIFCLEVDLSKNDGRFERIREQVQLMLSQLPHVGDPLPKLWKPIREDLRLKAKELNYISKEQLHKICESRGLKSKDDIKVMSNYIHDLGIITYFQDDNELRDFIVLNPQWAVDAVYALLHDNRIDKSNGHFNLNFLREIWDKLNYTPTEQRNLLNLMMKDKFEICFKVPDEDKYVAPQFLKDIRTDFGWNADDTLKFRLVYDFMPKGILTRLIVRFNNFITRNEEEMLVAKKTVIFEKDGCRAIIKETDFEYKGEINIQVDGSKSERRFVLWWIRNEIQQIHKRWFNNLQANQFVPCNCEKCSGSSNPYYFEYKYLVEFVDEGIYEDRCKESKKMVNILGLIDGIFTKSETAEIKNQLDRMEDSLKRTHENTIIIKQNTEILIEKLFEAFDENQLSTLQENIFQKIEENQSELPAEIVKEWKEATKSSPYKADIKGKIKLSIPLLLFISYDTEVSLDVRKVFEDIWKDIGAVSRGEKEFSELFIYKKINK